mmetsp:Transcript_4751/g.11486  ORF Transcript_4751/g.11486 Transcript_4751/m.11486 type:complete len:81 (+) Transcript_4751:74-316(+)
MGGMGDPYGMYGSQMMGPSTGMYGPYGGPSSTTITTMPGGYSGPPRQPGYGGPTTMTTSMPMQSIPPPNVNTRSAYMGMR